MDDRPAVHADVEFSVAGMTCGSCAARVERTLSRQEGLERAAVNLATERVVVAFDPGRIGAEELVTAVDRMGYGLAPATPRNAEARAGRHRGRAPSLVVARVLGAWPLALAVLVLSMVWMGAGGLTMIIDVRP